MIFAKYDALDIAEYVLWYCENTLINPITNLQLQKILYYIQGRYISEHSEPFFDNDMEAWSYGPVVPDVYYEYKRFISEPIVGILPQTKDLFESNEVELIQSVVKETYKMNVWELVNKTHRERPWKKNYELGLKNLIPIDDLIEKFKHK
ncbi:MAG: DUF4065 domain-containing protein [Romboutsia sp.]